jgi:hypothetical protein
LEENKDCVKPNILTLMSTATGHLRKGPSPFLNFVLFLFVLTFISNNLFRNQLSLGLK